MQKSKLSSSMRVYNKKTIEMVNSEITNAIENTAQLLIGNHLSLAFAESATAGRACAEFSLACNAGKFLKGGFVCYDATLKSSLLDVPNDLIEKYTPESMEVTKAIASGLRKIIDADIHIGITGLPCPGGSETDEKPVGTMFIYALLHGEPWFNERLQLLGCHQDIVEQTIICLAQRLSEYITAQKISQ